VSNPGGHDVKFGAAYATWKSSKPEVAKINAAGRITGVTAGWTTITMQVGGKTKKMLVRVLEEGSGVGSSLPDQI
jgi:hypothetical protein